MADILVPIKGVTDTTGATSQTAYLRLSDNGDNTYSFTTAASTGSGGASLVEQQNQTAVLQTISGIMQAQKDFEPQLLKDATNTLFILAFTRDQAGVIVPSHLNLDGTPYTPTLPISVPMPATIDYELIRTEYKATASGTGYSINDRIARIDVYRTDTANIGSTLWFNESTKVYISAPLAADITAITDYATEQTLSLINAKTDNLDIALSTLRDALRGGNNKTLSDVVVALSGVVLAAGSSIIGKVGIDQTTDGTTNAVSAKQNGSWSVGVTSSTLPTGAATALNQTTANSSLSSLETKVGEVQPSPTANTVLDRLKALLTGITLAQLPASTGQKPMAQSLPVVLASDSSGIVQSGNKATNSAAPTSDNIGALVAYATALPKRLVSGVQTLLNTDLRGQLRVVTSAQTLMDDIQVTTRKNQVEISFSVDTVPADGYATATLNGATITQGAVGSANAGLGLLATGTSGGAASIEIVSTQSLQYVPGAECYCEVSFRFDGQTNANKARLGIQSIGNSSPNDGLYLCNDGGTFGLLQVTNGTDGTYISSASFLDPLDGSAGSAFTSNGVPVVFDKTKVNLLRLRWAWFGAAPLVFEIMSPDGAWVEFYRYKMPNSSASLWATSSRFRFRAYLDRASGVTNSTMAIACVALGTTSGDRKGSSFHKRWSTATTNGTVVKAYSGVITGLHAYNTGASARFLKLYNTSVAPSVGTDTPFMTIPLWSSSSTACSVFVAIPPEGILCKTGISYAITSGVADTDTGIIGLNEVVVHMDYN